MVYVSKVAVSGDASLATAQYAGHTDHDLLVQWRAGDREAGQILTRRHYSGVYGFFSSKIAGDVKELVQGTFVVCVAKRGVYPRKKGSSFKTWLFGEARKKLYGYFRRTRAKRNRTVLVDPGEISCKDLGGLSYTWIVARCEDDLLRWAMPRIPLKLQLLLELYLCEGFTEGALAQVMGIPENAVRIQFRRAKELLREQMEPHGDTQAVERALRNIPGRSDLRPAEHRRQYPGFGWGRGSSASRGPRARGVTIAGDSADDSLVEPFVAALVTTAKRSGVDIHVVREGRPERD